MGTALDYNFLYQYEQRNPNMCWNLINSLPPPHRGPEEEQQQRKRVEAELHHQQREAAAAAAAHQQQREAAAAAAHQQQAAAAVRQQQLIAASRAMSERERAAYYPPPSAQVQRPQSVASKVDYGAPPAAHSRVNQGGKGAGQGEKPQLPKAEPPNFNLFGYHPSYQSPLAFLPQHQQADSKHMKQDHKPTQLIVTKSSSSSIDNPPPLLSDMKNSVIVKNEGKSPQSMDSVKPLMAHSPSPKPQGHYLASPVSSSPSSAAQMKYEYRSPSQSPHHLSHPHTPSPHPYEMNKVVGHHPRQARQSPHPPPHRQSPHPPPASQPPHHRQSPHQHQPHAPPPPSHRQSPHHPHPHPSPPSTVVYTSKPSATVLSYPYPAPGPPGIQHYAPPPASPALLKPKVSSPAPPHIYGKPGIGSGTPVVRTQDVTLSPLPLPAKPPLATSPYQQLSQHNPPPPHQVHPSAGLPPPPAAHSARVMYDQRGGATTVYPVAVSVKAPAASPPDHPHLALTPAVQTQPLDLGVSSSSVRLGSPGGGLSLSPKRKVCDEPEALDIKKRRSETPTSAPSDTISANASCVSEPVLSRVSEPSPLLANAATTITTVVNVAAAAAAATESVDNVGKPGTPAPCPSPAKPGSGVDSEKSNSPGPPRPVHKLKKAWLQRHSGEDVTSCVAPPSSPPATRKESPVISSLHSIGSMAVNSINKSSKPAKGARKGKDDASLHNGHLTPVKTTDADDSSSSDLERKTTPVKRVPPKLKRKKGGRIKAVAPASKKPQQTAVSASSTDSDKESGSEKDSDGKKTSAASNDKPAKDSASANGRKRGRRPKSTNNSSPNQTKNEGGEEPGGKKPRDDPPAPPPFQKQPTVAQLKKSGDSFLQDGPCFEVAPKLAKCRECRWTPNQRSRNMPNIFCRFYAFRRLRYTKNGQLAIAGFSDPHRDASHDDLKLWLPPPPDNPTPVPDLDMSRFLLSQLGDPFCHIIQQENEALSVHMSQDKVIAWKRVVQGVREMCDVCETTLFNYHWACSKCGFVVCIDCYKGRKNGTVKEWNDGSGVSGGGGVGGGGGGGRDRDEVSWLLCTNRQPHEQDKLMLTQIVAGDSLQIVSRKAHEACLHLGIHMNCACPHAQRLQAHVKPTNGINKDLLKNLRTKAEPVNGQIKQEKPEKDEESVEDNGGDNKKTDPLNWLADLALSSEDKKHGDTGSSDSDTEDGNHSTLRELLIRAPSTKGGHNATPEENSSSSPAPAASENGTTLPPNANANANAKDELTWKKKKEISKETDSKAEVKTEKLVHYVSRYTGASKGGSMSLPLRIMTLSESSLFYPDVPHLWLCDGKLLRLLDADNPGNYSIFQDQWKRGQPVMVSDVTKNMDMSLWHPDAFAKDFGDDKNHLVNCLTGKIVPNQPMRKFWEGFDSLAKRLKDEKGQPMVLKLKDWPPTEDFAEMLPTRFNDLMKVLPLKEYTTRGGRLNLASRLPECFVRPDLGPKMYTAYGSAGQHKGTTNLHLDISDAVNVMIYVSIPEDACEEDYNKEALRAIDEASCDILTRRRVREAGILPGAIWHIYLPRDADKIRDFLNKVALERGARLEPHHDPIHDQTWYIDTELQVRLYQEYNVQGFSIVQCQGDAVFIPAGAPHQVKNLHNCIKVAEDFVSPENVSHCFHLTQEFRELSDTHSNHEDKLQIKNIMYHAVKDSLGVLSTLKTEPSANDANPQPQPQATDES